MGLMALNAISRTVPGPNCEHVSVHSRLRASAVRSPVRNCRLRGGNPLGDRRHFQDSKIPVTSTKLSKGIMNSPGIVIDKKRRFQIVQLSAADSLDETHTISDKDTVDVTTSFPVPESNRGQHAASKQYQQRRRGGGGLHWIFGPLALLVTGALPALWLPISALFSGSAAAGLLAVLGLDATFNMGATAFLLMANGCVNNDSLEPKVPLGYKVWSCLVNLVGLGAPVALLVAYFRGVLNVQPNLQMLPAAALLGPYILLLVVQWLAEILVWQWRIAIWPVLPLVYQGYRLLQLTRGMELGAALDAPEWLLESARGLVAWWVLVLGMQIMWVASLIGKTPEQTATQQNH